MSEHNHLFSINFGYEQIECAQYQHGCNVMIDKDEAERRINEFPALEADNAALRKRVEELETKLTMCEMALRVAHLPLPPYEAALATEEA